MSASSTFPDFEQLPGAVKNNLTAEQWEDVKPRVIADGNPAPDSAVYVNLKNGQQRRYEAGELVQGPVIAAHNLAGGRGQDSTQFHTVPPNAPPGVGGSER
jgi:hypothetical protein